MALNTTNLTKFLKGITDAIRAKTGSTDPIKHKKIDEEISNIKTFNDCANNIVKMLAHCDRITDFSNMFSIPELTDETLNKISAVLDTSNGVQFMNMFANCRLLTTIPPLDTSNGIQVAYMFNNCEKLHTIKGQLSFKKHNDVLGYWRVFGNCKQLANVRFVENSIPAYEPLELPTTTYNVFDIHYSPYLTNDSVDSIIKGLCSNDTGYKLILRLHSDVIDKLTDEQILEIANKNWELG